MKEKDIKKGLIVIPISRARHYITSLENTPMAIEIIADGTDWCYDKQQVVQGPLLDRLCGIVGRKMSIDEDNKFVPNPDANLSIYPPENVVTVPEFLKRCRELRLGHERRLELAKQVIKMRESLVSRFKTLGLNVNIDDTSVTFDSLLDIEILLNAVVED